VEADSDNKNDVMFLSWHNPVFSSCTCGIFMRLRDFEGKSVLCHVEELQLQILADKLLQPLTS